METALNIRGLNKSFGKKHIIHDLSFEIRKGEVYGFLGPNGAGKTTVMKMIMGFLFPDTGTVEINGISLQKDYEQAMACVGGIIENPEMYKEFTGRQNLRLYARTHKGVTEARINEVVEMVRLQNRIDEKVSRYSLGMKQRLGLAQAMIHNPAVLILDEPTNGLDPAGIHEYRATLKQLAHEQGKAIMVSSHLLSEMQQLCDRVAIIQEGRLLGVEDIQHAAQQEGSRYLFDVQPRDLAADLLRQYFPHLEVTDEGLILRVAKEDVQKVLEYLLKKNIQISAMMPYKGSLETMFLQVTGGGKPIE